MVSRNEIPGLRQLSAARRLGARRRAGVRAGERAFTLLELMVVLAIIVVLVSMGVMRYQRAILSSKEAVLRTDLRDMREAIQNYTRDKEAAPNSLDDLVTSQYIARIPSDPMTGSPDWNAETCDQVLTPDQTSTGICDVHSVSDAVSPTDNTPYSSW
jgi:general secretion pathway protein G